MKHRQQPAATTELVRYDTMCRAIAEAVAVDEVKGIRDKAVAIEVYARQAKNIELERQALQIRVRAERRAGELLEQMEKAKGTAGSGRPFLGGNSAIPPKSDAPTLASIGITKAQSSKWQKLAAVPVKEFEAALATDPKRALLAVKKHQRGVRETVLAERTMAAARQAGTALYGVIYADPPWRFEPYSRDTGLDLAADNHYPTMTTEQVAALAIPAAPDCVLFLWATVPMLPQALDVLKAWGFDYRSACAWRKNRPGTGYWFRNTMELLLVGVRGSVPAPAPGEQYDSIIDAEVRAHSVKPNHFAEMIEAMFPTTPRLEMFARGPRLGWDVWGNEAE